jgi:hypothetical protein
VGNHQLVERFRAPGLGCQLVQPVLALPSALHAEEGQTTFVVDAAIPATHRAMDSATYCVYVAFISVSYDHNDDAVSLVW